MLSKRSPHRTTDELLGAQPRAGGVKVRGPTQFTDYHEEGGDGGAMKPQQPASSDAGGENDRVEPWIPSGESPCSGGTLPQGLSSLSIGKTTRLCH